MHISMNIQTKLVFFTAGTVLLVGGGISQFAAHTLRGELINHFETAVEKLANSTVAALVDPLYFLDIVRVRGELQQALNNSEVTLAVVLDVKGRVLSDGSAENPLWLQLLQSPIAQHLVENSQPIHEIMKKHTMLKRLWGLIPNTTR